MTQPKPLSPAAQAVLDAYLDQDTINFQGRDAVAAALRAIVANVMNVLVITETKPECKFQDAIHSADILAIAAELENFKNG